MHPWRGLVWSVLALAAGWVGCDKETVPMTQTIAPGDEVYYQYREGPEKRVTDRPAEVPVAQQGAVRVRSRGDRFAPVETDGGGTNVWVVDLLDGSTTARLKTQDYVIAARRAGTAAAEVETRLRRRATDVATRIAADPFLWRIETDGEPVYLFGTLHRAKRGELEELAPQVQEAFRSSETFVMETDLKAARRYVDNHSEVVYPDGVTLRQKLSRAHWQKLVSEFSGELPEGVLQHMRPWVLIARMSSLKSGRARPSKEFMDVQLRDWATTLDKAIRYLEPAKRQIDAFQKGFGLELLRRMLDHPESARVGPDELELTYETGRADKLEELVFETSLTLSRGTSGYRELLVERNRAWLPEIEGYLEEGGVFIAAGCAHFVGPDSVVAMLREKGYEVHRVP